MPAGPVLSDRQLNRALLARQSLLERTREPALETIGRLVGMQAQAPLAPYVALWSRLVSFDPGELGGLLESRAVVRANGLMRGTIHLVTADDAIEINALRQPYALGEFRRTSFSKALPGIPIEEVAQIGRRLLEERPLSLAKLAPMLAERFPGADPVSLSYVVRILLPTVQLPPRGVWGKSAPPTLALCEDWLGRPLPASVDPAPIVLRYLAAFGPASAADVRAWSRFSGMREVLDGLRPRLRTFRDAMGRELFDVEDGQLPDPEIPAPVRFFPEYDNVFFAHDPRTRIIPAGYEPHLAVPPTSGATAGTFTVDGFLAGRWRLARARNPRLMLWMPANPSAPVEDEVRAEAEGLLRFVLAGQSWQEGAAIEFTAAPVSR